jgi:hypothetical protein
MMKLLFDHEKALLQYNEKTNAIELIWKKFHDEPTYRLMFTKGLEHLIAYNATCWLSDIRNEGIVSPKNSEWLQKEILSNAISRGLKKIAVVMQKDVFKEFYITNIVKQTQNNMMKYFDSIETANEWLLEK